MALGNEVSISCRSACICCTLSFFFQAEAGIRALYVTGVQTCALPICNSAGSATVPEIAMTADGRPVIAWNDDGSGSAQVYVKRWTGTDWQEFGQSATGAGASDDSEIGRAPGRERGWTSARAASLESER